MIVQTPRVQRGERRREEEKGREEEEEEKEGHAAEGLLSGRRAEGGGRGAQARGQKWCDAPIQADHLQGVDHGHGCESNKPLFGYGLIPRESHRRPENLF